MSAGFPVRARGPLVVLDADSTLIREEAIELLADEAGSLEHVAAVTERAMRGELDFAASLRERVATLRGVDIAVLPRVRERMTPTPGIEALVRGVHAAGGRVGVVSGGFHELLDPLAERLGLDFCRANRLAVDGDRLTGEVEGPIIDADAKAAALAEWAEASGIPLASTVAVGDGANDLRMLARAALGVAFCAKPIVRAEADLAIDRPDLSSVLPLLGLPRG
ncbi:phosphoserine phosphatase SerB [Agromyces sp. CFH 90414]|uniref:phosphoserine phosphatase n=1 Tax=Agromyces agglutinans TaxID=2662258 RepID=A0A6I2F6F9_9MICO|nr:phosphoserine phosphatase SerB [Agromyces agglutinans]MRG58450.1 phosphoserine phosphatase SerB [Agromyces agglutinans]